MFLYRIYYEIRSRYNIVWTFNGLFFAFISFFYKIPRNIDILFVGHDVHRNAKKNGKLYNPLIDPIIESFHKDNIYNILTLATPFSRHFGPECHGNVRIHSFRIVISVLKRFFLKGSFKLKKIENDPLINAYKNLLKKINPKFIIGAQPSVELCIAASKLKIKTYDMQHGLISDVNYYSITKRESINQLGWPDNVLCWDIESSERLNKITKGLAKAVIIGHPSYHSESGKNLHANQIKNIIDSNYKNRILVTLTHHDYGMYFEDNCYKEIGIPSELVGLMLKLPKIFWRIRLHPVQYKFYYERVNSYLCKIFDGHDNINWELYSDISFGAAIYGCNGHITVSSASALDAAQNSIPTLFVGCSGVVDYKIIRSYFKEYLESGIMTYTDASSLNNSSISFFSKLNNNVLLMKNKNYKSHKYFRKFIKKIKKDINIS